MKKQPNDAPDGVEAKQLDGRPCIDAVCRESLSLLEAALESTADGILIADGKGKLVRFNQMFVRMWRLPKQVVDSGSDEAALAFVQDQLCRPDQFMAKVRELYDHPDATSFDVLIFKDGRVFERYSQPQRIDGQAMGRVWSFRDVTERTRAEEVLREREERSRATLASMTDLVFVLDQDGRFVDCHAPEVSSMHALLATFKGQSFTAVLPSTLVTDLTRALGTIRAGAPVQHVDYELEVNGERTIWSANVCPRWDRDGKYDGATIVARDMTVRARLEDRLRQTEQLAAIGRLAGGVAHDFNNQLAIVMGYADLLAAALDDGELRRHANAIIAAAHQAADLTQKLLAFARKGKFLTVPVDVHRLLTDVTTILSHTIDKRISIHRTFRHSGSPIVCGDPAQLQNALLNLALNARDAMPAGGDLTFETDAVTISDDDCRKGSLEIAPGQYIRISIADTGCGMTPEVKKHLFEPFFTTKKLGKGTGMGLASVYGAVQSHHGTIRVESEVGRGTTVRLCLPLRPDMIVPEDSQKAAPLVTGSAQILVVDDEESILNVAATMLRSLGHHVITCRDGKEAVDYYQANWRELDLVILDMVMPVMSGWDAFQAMRRINPQVRALLSSGCSLDGEAQTILDKGVLGFIGKPYQCDELSQAVAAARARTP